LQNVGHSPHIEAPADTNRILVEVLR
jgi:hypothetical protein